MTAGEDNDVSKLLYTWYYAIYTIILLLFKNSCFYFDETDGNYVYYDWTLSAHSLGSSIELVPSIYTIN